MNRIITETLMQCWDCRNVQAYPRAQVCDECGGPVEVLQTLDTGGVWVSPPLDLAEYRKRGVNVLKVLAGSEEACYYQAAPAAVATVELAIPRRPEFKMGWVRVDYDEIKAATEKAVLIVVDDEEMWMPTSQIDADYSNQVGDGPGYMFVTEWIAEQKGLS